MTWRQKKLSTRLHSPLLVLLRIQVLIILLAPAVPHDPCTRTFFAIMVNLILMLPVSSSYRPLQKTDSQDKKAYSYCTRKMVPFYPATVTPYSPCDILLYCVLYFLVLLILRFWLLCRVTFLRHVSFSCSFLLDTLFFKSVSNASRSTGLGFCDDGVLGGGGMELTILFSCFWVGFTEIVYLVYCTRCYLL